MKRSVGHVTFSIFECRDNERWDEVTDMQCLNAVTLVTGCLWVIVTNIVKGMIFEYLWVIVLSVSQHTISLVNYHIGYFQRIIDWLQLGTEFDYFISSWDRVCVDDDFVSVIKWRTIFSDWKSFDTQTNVSISFSIQDTYLMEPYLKVGKLSFICEDQGWCEYCNWLNSCRMS
jgi:hypothetical protein